MSRSLENGHIRNVRNVWFACIFKPLQFIAQPTCNPSTSLMSWGAFLSFKLNDKHLLLTSLDSKSSDWVMTILERQPLPLSAKWDQKSKSVEQQQRSGAASTGKHSRLRAKSCYAVLLMSHRLVPWQSSSSSSLQNHAGLSACLIEATCVSANSRFCMPAHAECSMHLSSVSHFHFEACLEGCRGMTCVKPLKPRKTEQFDNQDSCQPCKPANMVLLGTCWQLHTFLKKLSLARGMK